MNRLMFTIEYKIFLAGSGLTPAHAVVIGGGAVLLHGLRDETKDVNLDVPEWFYDDLLKRGRKETQLPVMDKEPYRFIQWSNKVTLHRGIEGKVVMVDGCSSYTPRKILKQKKALNRVKDQLDIAVLHNHLYCS
jgi:hypothetical protein